LRLLLLPALQAQLGRDLGPSARRWGPRPIDLDIIFYEGQTVTEGETLVVPHPRWQERDFVKAPLADLCGSSSRSVGSSSGLGAEAGQAVDGSSSSEEEERDIDEPSSGRRAPAAGDRRNSDGLQGQLQLAARLWQAAGGERQLGTPDLECVLPMGRLGLWPWQRRTQVGPEKIPSMPPGHPAAVPKLSSVRASSQAAQS
jgi:hypothetical protein